MVFATLNSTVPEITVTDSAPPSSDGLVTFGGVTEGTPATQTVTVTNSGSGNLVLGSIGQSNLGTAFALATDDCSGRTIAPASSCAVDVTFSPPSTGDFSGSLTIPSNDLDEPVVTIQVSGTGVALPVPKVVVTDSAGQNDDLNVPFGSVTENQTASQTVTVANGGNAALDILQVAMANALLPPFYIVNDNCSNQTVPATPLANCTFDVEFRPTVPGTFPESFDIPSNDPDTPSVTVTVSGTGTSFLIPAITVTDSSSPTDDLLVGFRNVNTETSADQTITVTNDGTGNLDIGTVDLNNLNPDNLDPPPAGFSIATDDCSSQSIPPAASCTIGVTFAPEVIQTYTGNVTIPSNDPDAVVVMVLISGDGGTPEQEPSAEGATRASWHSTP